jgi:hypothetical protein
MPHDQEVDSISSNSDFKALLLKAMPISWQDANALKDPCTLDGYCQMLSYFVQYQSISDKH